MVGVIDPDMLTGERHGSPGQIDNAVLDVDFATLLACRMTGG